jgi:Zn finger protein HypA/HybF involved in hydrogenase expression
MLPDGNFAKIMPNESEFSKQVVSSKSLVEDEVPSGLKCPICKNIFNNAVLIPCCGTSFCDGCITKTLVEDTNFKCPECKSENISIDNLIPNKNLRNSVEELKTNSILNSK